MRHHQEADGDAIRADRPEPRLLLEVGLRDRLRVRRDKVLLVRMDSQREDMVQIL